MADAERTQSVGLSEMKGFRVTQILRKTFEHESKMVWLPRYCSSPRDKPTNPTILIDVRLSGAL